MSRFLNFFLPQDKVFFTMLASQMETVREASEEFEAFISDFRKLDMQARQKSSRKIHEIENEGDIQAHEIIESIQKSFVTPIDREDIHQLAVLIDDLLDLIDEAIHFILLYNVKQIPAEMEEFMRINQDMAASVAKAISRLPDYKKLKEHCMAIHEIENRADVLYSSIMGSLFENGGDALYIMKMKDLYDKFEELADKGEDIANILENIAVKHG